MILKFTYYGDPILRKKTEPVNEITDEIRKLAADMIETIEKTSNAIGLSAPQVNQSVALFVVQFPDKNHTDKWVPGPFEVHLNPKILEISEEGWYYSEGCLSIPGLYCEVPRPVKIKFQSMDLNGKTNIREYAGYEARMLMHENDHLNGVLFIDRISPEERKRIEPELREIRKKFKK